MRKTALAVAVLLALGVCNQTGQTGTTTVAFRGVPSWLVTGGRAHVTVANIVLPAGTHTLRIRVTGTKNAASTGWNIALDSADLTR